jgi:hypothetical protein
MKAKFHTFNFIQYLDFNQKSFFRSKYKWKGFIINAIILITKPI